MILIVFGYILWVFSGVYSLLLLARVVLDWVRFFAPRWQPEGVVLVLANTIFGLTDPPVNWLRRFIPPLRLGAVALDVGFIVLFVAVALLGRLGGVLISLGVGVS